MKFPAQTDVRSPRFAIADRLSRIACFAGPGEDDDDETPIGDPDDDDYDGEDEDDEDDEDDTLWTRSRAPGA